MAPDAILARLKGPLQPLRPVLLPVWRRVRPYLEAPARHPGEPGAPSRVVAVGPNPADITPAHPIRPLRKTEFDALAREFPYYTGRWSYMSVACRIAGDLIERNGLTTALELGPHLRSVIVGADVLDNTANPALESEGRVVIHDATRAPWPFEDKAYDLFVALQVFEHLRGEQRAAFREVRRTARAAIISLPIDWVMDDPRNCHHQLSHETVLSWFAPVVPTRVEIGNGGPRKRLIYVFEGLE